MQADCYVGVWAYSVQKRAMLELGEIETGSAAALMVAGPQNSRTQIRVSADAKLAACEALFDG